MEITKYIITKRNEALLRGDHAAYRAQLSRRLLKVRRRLGRTAGKSRKYTAAGVVTAGDIVGNNEYVYLVLLTAERAWAHAMQMKNALSSGRDKQGINNTARKHIVSRLNKAVKVAEKLITAIDDPASGNASEEDVLEARAYVSSLEGACYFEKHHWRNCLQSYSTARVIYSAFAASHKEPIFQEILSSTVDPSIRYAAYKADISRGHPIPRIAKEFFPQDDNRLSSLIEKLEQKGAKEGISKASEEDGADEQPAPSTITWRGRTVNLDDAAIALPLAAVSSGSVRLSKALLSPETEKLKLAEKAAKYDDVLIPSQDAVDATNHAISELVREGVSTSDARMQSLQIIRTAVEYALVGWRVGRNRTLAGDQDGAEMNRAKAKEGKKAHKEETTTKMLSRFREQVVLYDGIIQSIDSVKELLGVAADEAFVKELQGKRDYFRALKCLSIARSHALLSEPRNALALLSRALSLCSSSFTLLSSSPPPDDQTPPTLVIYSSTIQNLQSLLQKELTRQHALVELSTHLFPSPPSASKEPSYARPLVESLDTYPSSGKIDFKSLVSYPPKMEPVPVKPIFLDVAWNYIEYPGRRREDVGGQRRQSLSSTGNTAASRDAKKGKDDVSKGKEGAEGDEKKGKRGWFGFGRG
ncbi:MAG: hypothetical protein M1823_001531 [Watsoniomyces obsoletus]|nr:MAG: hypothetical protein M1823_001531 [Watsoniomyces obsoletus]